MVSIVSLVATSRAQDSGYRALSDIAAVTGQLGVAHRILGGQMVSLLVATFEVDAPPRETADADFGAAYEVLADRDLVLALADLGYTRAAGNRFVRNDGDDERAIDILGPSYTGRHRPNQPHGDLVVDEVPGVGLSLAIAPVIVELRVQLTTRQALTFPVSLPTPRAALVVKALAWSSRRAPRDAVDVHRLLEVAAAAKLVPTEWPTRGESGDARSVLIGDFGRFNAAGAKAASPNADVRVRISQLVAAHVGR